jgi:hypothetical protein
LPINGVMTLGSQPVAQFAVLAVAGSAIFVLTAVLVTDFRGFLTWYTHRCWQKFQEPSYRKALAWTRWQRDSYADEHKVRGIARGVSGLGLVMGTFLLVIEVAAVATGHVG